MSLLNSFVNIVTGVIDTVSSSEPLIGALKFTAKAVAPILLSNINDTYKSDIKYRTNISETIENKRQVGVMNGVMGENIDLVSYEILNCVNSISNAINELIEELGENNVYIDELLISYFIQKFNVPQKYVDKVYRILENSYAIENKCLRDGIKLNNFKVKKKEMETDGGKEILKQRKHGDIDNIMIDKALANLIMEDIDEEDIKLILG
jgi:hypothetical protein